MKKLPHKYKFPLTASFVMPSMLLGMPAISTWRNLDEEALFLEQWLNAVGQTVPLALALMLTVATIARLIVSRFLVEAKEK